MFLAAGCGQGAGKPKGPPKIALVMKSLANEFFKTMEDGATAHQKQHASEYALLANGTKDETDVEAQINIVDQMIAQRVDALVIAPADSKALIPVCKRARDAGIVVVNIDNKFDAAVLADKNIQIPFVGPDNRKGARLAGEHLAKKLKSGDPVALVEGAPNAFNSIQRKLGFEDAMNAAGMKIVTSQTGYWETDKAEGVVAGMIREHPDLKAVLCSNDSMALGAVAALKSARKLQDAIVIGFDNIAAVQEMMKKGEILCTVDQHADKIAVFGIEYALEILAKKAAPADKETPVDLITGESGK
ncbi:MAG: sugar ABC transporter substrate-binding protein [Planctomycetota bacterium]